MGIKSTSERSLAVFIDFENLALGFTGRNDRFDIRLVLKRLLEKGKIVAKKAYADWNRFSSYTGPLHEAAIELIEIPRRGQTGKNSADIRLCVDAMDLAYSKEHIDTFVVVSGDSDFSPLVSKLKELGKHVIGLGMSTSTSNLLRDNCDEFIYYEDLTQEVAVDQVIKVELPDAKRKAFMLLLNAATALRRENKEILHPSQIKATMQRMKPSFNESYHGYRTFSALLEDAQREGLLILDTDKRSGTYVVTHFGAEIEGSKSAKTSPTPLALPVPSTSSAEPLSQAQPLVEAASIAEVAQPLKPSRGRRRRGGRGRRRNGGEAQGNAEGGAQEFLDTGVVEAEPQLTAHRPEAQVAPIEQAPGLPSMVSEQTVASAPPKPKARSSDTSRRPTNVGRTPSQKPREKAQVPAIATGPVADDVSNAPQQAREISGENSNLGDEAPAIPAPPAKKRRSRGGRGRGGRGKPKSEGSSNPSDGDPEES